MTVNDPRVTRVTEIHTSAADPQFIERPQVIEVRESNTAWWVGALVAIVAILAVVFLVTRAPATSDSEFAQALEQGRAQGAMEATQSTLNAAQQSIQNAQDSAARAASDAARATAEAREQAAMAAASAADATANAGERLQDNVTPVPAQ